MIRFFVLVSFLTQIQLAYASARSAPTALEVFVGDRQMITSPEDVQAVYGVAIEGMIHREVKKLVTLNYGREGEKLICVEVNTADSTPEVLQRLAALENAFGQLKFQSATTVLSIKKVANCN